MTGETCKYPSTRVWPGLDTPGSPSPPPYAPTNLPLNSRYDEAASAFFREPTSFLTTPIRAVTVRKRPMYRSPDRSDAAFLPITRPPQTQTACDQGLNPHQQGSPSRHTRALNAHRNRTSQGHGSPRLKAYSNEAKNTMIDVATVAIAT